MGAQDDYTTLQELAERLQLDDKERESFITSSMKRLGYRPRTDWDEPEEGDGKGDSGDFFSGRRQQREQRQVGGQQQQRRGGGDWQYGG